MTNDGVSRLFLAVHPPGEVIGEIAGIQKRLQKSLAGDIRWVKPEGMHVTLKFFGDVFNAEIGNISREIGPNAAGEAPFTLLFRGLGVFPSAKRPRVLHLGLDGDVQRLTVFQSRLERALSAMGFAARERSFTPHITLARIKALREPEKLAKEMAEGKHCATGQFTASALVLFKSSLTPKGAFYTRLAEYPFSGGVG